MQYYTTAPIRQLLTPVLFLDNTDGILYHSFEEDQPNRADT